MSTDRTIVDVISRALYDSNGRVALEVEVLDQAGRTARAIAQRGSSVGDYEPRQLEDAGVQPGLAAATPALRCVSERVAPALRGRDASDLTGVDTVLNELDPRLSRDSVGGNVTIATSMAVAQLGALQQGIPLHTYLQAVAGRPTASAPTRPAFNLIDGGLGPKSKVPHIEFLLFPAPGAPLAEVVETGVRARDRVLEACYQRGYEGGASQQGAVSAPLQSCEEGLELLLEVLSDLEDAEGCRLGLDMAASDVHDSGLYAFPWAESPLKPEDLLRRYRSWVQEYGVCYIEDGFASSETDWFVQLMEAVGDDIMVAGDDLYASNTARITEGALRHWANTAVVKPNQAGTVTDTLKAARAALDYGATLLISQRSGENEGSFISSLALAAGAHYLKVGGPTRIDRIAKINELLRVGATA
ncbi:hypothetical protein O1Q96_00070 (plasmid) [Streptomyces sp. Qhu-G9]|uniref:hypothetical protein n=1 Tax=Streptomyces sp. Qhu-G9 TaxID=3452799 RepID=UPI0022ABE981|nr:hypothetical protein [Streptomyces aurantiacus]WAU78287.1 hypothetical protein O1Q96_00070 [Streptomyces aurantiacus]